MSAASTARQLPPTAFPEAPAEFPATAKPGSTENKVEIENRPQAFPSGPRAVIQRAPAPKLESIQKMARSDELESLQKSVSGPGRVRGASGKKLSSIKPPENRILIRPACPADTESVRRFLTGLSAESSYRRFFTGLGRIPERFVRQFVDVDHRQREALVAMTGAAVIALADYTLVDGYPQTAEMGVVVADGWQRRGLGRQLVGQLLTVAHDRGVRQLRAHTLAENARVARLLRRGWPTARPVREETLLVWHLPLDTLPATPPGRHL